MRIEGGLDWHCFSHAERLGFNVAIAIRNRRGSLPPLLETLDAGPTGEFAFICGANGKSMTKESLGNAFSEACRAAGIQKSAHGLRKIGATRAANNVATVAPVAIGATQAGSDPGVSSRLCQRESGDLLIDSALASIRSQTIADRAIFQIVIGSIGEQLSPGGYAPIQVFSYCALWRSLNVA